MCIGHLYNCITTQNTFCRLRRKDMKAGSKKWLGVLRRTFSKLSCKSAVALDVASAVAAAAATKETSSYEQENNRRRKKLLVVTIEDVAATKIQARFRGHLARRAFRALRSLVKLQALARGVSVRRQARIATQCMQAMVRLQVRVQARQLLNSSAIHIEA